jgi:hypothetical protein
MSKRHTASRRRTYGRRQHELHERVDRRHDRRTERAWRTGQEIDPSGYLDAQGGEPPYGFAD